MYIIFYFDILFIFEIEMFWRVYYGQPFVQKQIVTKVLSILMFFIYANTTHVPICKSYSYAVRCTFSDLSIYQFIYLSIYQT